MNKRHRVEITVVRRTTIFLRNQSAAAGSGYQPRPDNERSDQSGAGGPAPEGVDFLKGQLVQAEAARAPELARLIEALVKTRGRSPTEVEE